MATKLSPEEAKDEAQATVRLIRGCSVHTIACTWRPVTVVIVREIDRRAHACDARSLHGSYQQSVHGVRLPCCPQVQDKLSAAGL